MSRSKPLQPTLWELERRFGAGTLTPASALRGLHISTGYPAVDALLTGGGIRAGQMTALVGIPTSGATTLLYRLIASAQRDDRTAAYVDPTNTFDAESAVLCDVTLNRLLLVAPVEPERALQMTLDLVRVDQAALVALHWNGSDPQGWERLRANVARTRTALVILCSALPLLDTFYTVLALQRRAWLTTDAGTVEGYQVKVHVQRDGGTERDHATEIAVRWRGAYP